MTDLQLYTELIALPADLKKEVEGFITSLKAKAQTRPAARQRQFGGAAGFFKMHDDFDEPLDDFKEYVMKLLLDTHTLIWFMNGDAQLSEKLKGLIADLSNECFVSIVSIWEIAIKVRLNKLDLAGPFDRIAEFLAQNDIRILPIAFEHLQNLMRLELYHRDPFDRLIIAQAQVEALTLMSKDGVFGQYNLALIWD